MRRKHVAHDPELQHEIDRMVNEGGPCLDGHGSPEIQLEANELRVTELLAACIMHNCQGCHGTGNVKISVADSPFERLLNGGKCKKCRGTGHQLTKAGEALIQFLKIYL